MTVLYDLTFGKMQANVSQICARKSIEILMPVLNNMQENIPSVSYHESAVHSVQTQNLQSLHTRKSRNTLVGGTPKLSNHFPKKD